MVIISTNRLNKETVFATTVIGSLRDSPFHQNASQQAGTLSHLLFHIPSHGKLHNLTLSAGGIPPLDPERTHNRSNLRYPTSDNTRI